MADDLSAFNKLSQLIPTGKARDYTEAVVGKEVPRRRKRKKNEPGWKPKKDPENETQTPDDRKDQLAGKLLDIIV
jgi:hypothetical protein